MLMQARKTNAMPSTRRTRRYAFITLSKAEYRAGKTLTTGCPASLVRLLWILARDINQSLNPPSLPGSEVGGGRRPEAGRPSSDRRVLHRLPAPATGLRERE